MGFFSWKTQDTGRSISNVHSSRGAFPVFMHDDKGNTYSEFNYDGYGEFGGVDFYQLLAEMNGGKTREDGLDMAFDKNRKGKLRYPNLSEDPNWMWTNEEPQTCRDQGFFYNDEDYDESDYDEEPF